MMKTLYWQDAPTRTQSGHDMVVTTVALGKDHSVDLYCERSKTAEAEALLKKPWVGLTNKERSGIENYCEMIIGKAAFDAIEAKLKEKNT